jgi:hypothetical protein
VHVDVSLPNEAKTIDEMVRPIAVNSSGVEVAGLEVAPDLVRAQLHLTSGSGGSK